MSSFKPSLNSGRATKSDEFKAYYHPLIGGAVLTLGLVVALASLWIMLLSGRFSGMLPLSSILAVIGVVYLTRPYFVLRPNRLTVHNLVQSSHSRRYPFVSLSDFSIEDEQLYIDAPASGGYLGDSGLGDSDRTQVKLTIWAIKPTDWKKFQRLIRNSSD